MNMLTRLRFAITKRRPSQSSSTSRLTATGECFRHTSRPRRRAHSLRAFMFLSPKTARQSWSIECGLNTERERARKISNAEDAEECKIKKVKCKMEDNERPALR